MNRQWSEENRRMQIQLRRRETFDAGMDTLFALREQLMQTLCAFRGELCREDFSAMPFPNANGYHSKTIAYSIWHIFRIEDIVAHCVIRKETQVLSSGGYQGRIRSPIITTGNELAGRQIAAFSAQLDLDALYAYAAEVKESTEALLKGLPYDALKQKIPPDRREHCAGSGRGQQRRECRLADRFLVRQGCARSDPDAVFTPLDHAHRGMPAHSGRASKEKTGNL